jgi:hypothetical protein
MFMSRYPIQIISQNAVSSARDTHHRNLMEAVVDDPELAKQVVKLLGQELKLVRAQLEEATAVIIP